MKPFIEDIFKNNDNCVLYEIFKINRHLYKTPQIKTFLITIKHICVSESHVLATLDLFSSWK